MTHGAAQDRDPGHRHGHDAACAPAAAARLTPGRKAVLDILESARRPIGAYEMIDILAASAGRRPAPTQVYRALDFLVEQGLVHRLASRNAYLACGHGHEASEPVAFLICDGCGHVDEATSPSPFGRCRRCRGQARICAARPDHRNSRALRRLCHEGCGVSGQIEPRACSLPPCGGGRRKSAPLISPVGWGIG
ncbi:MAG: transcriptional repressor [Rhodoblastus sp.]